MCVFIYVFVHACVHHVFAGCERDSVLLVMKVCLRVFVFRVFIFSAVYLTYKYHVCFLLL